MKKIYGIVFAMLIALCICGCSQNDLAELQYNSEARSAKYRSEYATVVNKLEMREGNFDSKRRVTFYNVRLGETIFVCEGYAHVQIDPDGDVEIVVKTGHDKYLRHYLGQKQDITYFSEQLESNEGVDSYEYKIYWNPHLWLPSFTANKNLD